MSWSKCLLFLKTINTSSKINLDLTVKLYRVDFKVSCEGAVWKCYCAGGEGASVFESLCICASDPCPSSPWHRSSLPQHILSEDGSFNNSRILSLSPHFRLLRAAERYAFKCLNVTKNEEINIQKYVEKQLVLLHTEYTLQRSEEVRKWKVKNPTACSLYSSTHRIAPSVP